MKLTTYDLADDFLDVALDPLLREEEKNNLILGISMRVRDGRKYGEESPLFLTVHDADELVAAAIRTPPYNMILHCEDNRLDALDVIVEHLIDTGHQLPGANGTVDVVAAFVEKWSQRTGESAFVRMEQRIYTLMKVFPPANVSGHMRWAREEDVPTLVTWFLGFCEDAVPDDPPANPEKNVRQFMKTGKLAVWDDNGMVSMTGSSRGTPNGATVSAVYTPPEHRGNGYASGCVAALSQSLLDDGNHFCTLYADLSNPTSNKIYQNVGYRPVVDCAMYLFGEAKEQGPPW
ncbi:GNAT family N-acetyltransferase [Candidatus Bipolaricaulota bacterium]